MCENNEVIEMHKDEKKSVPWSSLVVLIGCLLLLIWLTLPFTTMQISLFDGEFSETFQRTGFNSIFGQFQTVTLGQGMTLRLPGSWTSALALLFPIFIVAGSAIFCKKDVQKILLALVAIGTIKAMYYAAVMQDLTALVSRTALEAFDGTWQPIFGEYVNASPGIGKILLVGTWLVLLAFCFWSMRRAEKSRRTS